MTASGWFEPPVPRASADGVGVGRSVVPRRKARRVEVDEGTEERGSAPRVEEGVVPPLQATSPAPADAVPARWTPAPPGVPTATRWGAGGTNTRDTRDDRTGPQPSARALWPGPGPGVVWRT